MPESALLGYARPFVRGPALDWQHEVLRKAGIPERHIYTEEKPLRRPDSRDQFGQITRALRPGDILTVPCLAVFARNREEVMATFRGLGLRQVGFWSIGDEIDTRENDDALLFKLGDATVLASGIWKRERTVRAAEMAKRGHRMGRRPQLGPRKDAEARALWLDPESDKTSAEIAELVGLSAARLYVKFGKRWRA